MWDSETVRRWGDPAKPRPLHWVLPHVTPFPPNNWSQSSVQTGTKHHGGQTASSAAAIRQHLQTSPTSQRTHLRLHESNKATFNLFAPRNTNRAHIFFHPNFTSFSLSLPPAKDEPEGAISCPTPSLEPVVCLVPFTGLAYVCSDEAEQKQAREDFNFPSFRRKGFI